MGDRHNTIVCCFDPRSPQITAVNIHEWIYECLHMPEENIRMLQIDGARRRIYIKFTDGDYMNQILQDTDGHLEYKHDNGEISQVQTQIVGVGTKKIRVANLPPEVKENEIKAHMSKYGEVRSIRDEMRAAAYRYKV